MCRAVKQGLIPQYSINYQRAVSLKLRRPAVLLRSRDRTRAWWGEQRERQFSPFCTDGSVFSGRWNRPEHVECRPPDSGNPFPMHVYNGNEKQDEAETGDNRKVEDDRHGVLPANGALENVYPIGQGKQIGERA